MTHEGGITDPAKARVALDAIKWATSKLAPKHYGDKLVTENKTEISGPGGGPAAFVMYAPGERLRD